MTFPVDELSKLVIGSPFPGKTPAVKTPCLTVIFAVGMILNPHLTTLADVHLWPPVVYAFGDHKFAGLLATVPPPASGLT